MKYKSPFSGFIGAIPGAMPIMLKLIMKFLTEGRGMLNKFMQTVN